MYEVRPFVHSMMRPFYDIDQMNHDFFGDTPIRSFQTDVRDNGNSYTLEAELPGFSREDIAIDIDGDQLTIQAHHKSDSEKNTGSYLRRERYYGSYSRSFDISEIESDQISAAYENGVLRLELPKKSAVVPKSRRLEIH